MTQQEPEYFQQTIAPASIPAPEPLPAPESPAKKPSLFFPYLLLTVFFLTLLPGPLFFLSLLLPGPMQEAKTIVIQRGMSVQAMGDVLDQSGVLIHPLLFRTMARFMAEDKLKAGEYEFKPGQTVIDVVSMMRDGLTVVRQFTAAEGLTSHEIVNLLNDVPVLTGAIDKVPPEGSLLPETYRYNYGDTRQSVVDHMQKEQRATMEALWAGRGQAARMISSPQEAVILASIVEKETGKRADERARVAGVFLNRLRIGMALQSDPTVIYALTKGRGALGRSLTKADLALSSPYNTYENRGLPPGPICNPGRAALEAVLNPEMNDFLYFVADGSGGHAFAKTLDEHNRNVARWISLNRP